MQPYLHSRTHGDRSLLGNTNATCFTNCRSRRYADSCVFHTYARAERYADGTTGSRPYRSGRSN